MSIVLVGSTSGSVTLQEPAVAGTTVIDLPATSGTMVVTGGAQTVQFAAGSASTPSITFTGDTNTGIFSPAADTIAFTEGGTESMRITSTGNVGIGTTAPTTQLEIKSAAFTDSEITLDNTSSNTTSRVLFKAAGTEYGRVTGDATQVLLQSGNIPIAFRTNGSERMRIDSSGFVMVGTTNTNPAENNVKGVSLGQDGRSLFSAMGTEVVRINRGTDDGVLVWFHQAGTAEGNISVSGTTVSYNGGHLSRWSQLPDGSKDDTILKGTVMSNLDDMCVWEKEGVVAENEQLNKMKVSDVEGDTNVAGVFVNWTIDEQYGVDDMNVAMTGDMIIRIADGVVVQKGDLLMSAGDGTAKPQGDDIVRSKTVAKVTSNHVTCTYADGSYCVPCVLMAC
jgi:hypothetical protein